MNGEMNGEVSAKQSIKRQLHTTHVEAVGWEPHSSSTTTCAGKVVDHELPVNKSKGHTYTNPRPGHYLTHTPSHITCAVAAMDSCFALKVDFWLRTLRRMQILITEIKYRQDKKC